MPSSKPIVATTAAATLLLGAVAFAASFDHGAHTWTASSGYTGSVAELTVSNGSGINGLSFYEELDDPVLIGVEGHRLTDGIGEYNYLGDVHVRLGFGSSEYLDVGRDQFITAIRVCTTDNNDTDDRKLKGVEVWSARIQADGSLQPMVNSLEFHRAGCKVWQSKVSCGTNQVATGLRGHYATVAKGFFGIALRCTSLKPR